ncbi:MAG: Gfo/Idh/MocA family protein [Marinilabiliaceae bacterium]
MKQAKVGFIGAGGIARAHAFALDALKYYYDDAPAVEFNAVASARSESRGGFARKYGFDEALSPEDLFRREDIDTVFVLGPNHVHYKHLESALQMKNIKRVYLEKPICSTREEEQKIHELAGSAIPSVDVRIGFQLLASSAIRKALQLWHSGAMGRPVHFRFNYMHRDYLDKGYREKRRTRLTPAPDGGAMADLGSHAVSMMIAFLGHKMEIVNALQGGTFPDVPVDSDLYSEISLLEKNTGAVGHLSASRISAGMGDKFSFEIFAEKGALRYNSYAPDSFEYFDREENVWKEVFTGSDYKPATAFPSGHVPGGWLRPLIHAHYEFLSGNVSEYGVPDLKHGLEVQRLVRETADHLEKFRKIRDGE